MKSEPDIWIPTLCDSNSRVKSQRIQSDLRFEIMRTQSEHFLKNNLQHFILLDDNKDWFPGQSVWVSGERVTQSDENENNKAVLHSQYNSVAELTSS